MRIPNCRISSFVLSAVIGAAAAVAMMTAPAPVAAQYVGPGVAATPDVRAILAQPQDDQWVILKGHLLRKTGKERYVFSDGTGEIQVEIDDKDFPREPVDEKTLVEISGEVDTGLTRPPEIDVDVVRIIRE
ncbi:YgiW/YdeI family stress tolerance OB fold protein [Kerstersia gyiorum]|uniref:YgiW/YdeI family stress tolerance OB fold protein n=1 Tax=Kerstersia gyiorum TaxID=206506 RepID=UPI003B42BCEE